MATLDLAELVTEPPPLTSLICPESRRESPRATGPVPAERLVTVDADNKRETGRASNAISLVEA